MDNKPDKPNRTLILYFALSVIFAVLSILASRIITVTYFLSFAKITINLKWMFWLSATISIAFILPLIRSLLSALHQQGRLPKVVGWFFRDEVIAQFEIIVRMLQSFFYSTVGRLTVAGIGVFLLMIAMWRSGVLHETEVASNLFTIVNVARGQDRFYKEADFLNVRLMNYLRPDKNNYLTDYLKLVRDLKVAGAKVVVLSIPYSIEGANELKMLRELEQTGIVVFATSQSSAIRIADSTGVRRLSVGTRSMRDREVDESFPLARLQPSGTHGVVSIPLMDLSIEVLRKFKGYEKDMPYSLQGNEFRFGEWRIPVTSDGWMYSRDRGFPPFTTLVYVDSVGDWKYSFNGAKFSSLNAGAPGLKIAPNTSNTQLRDIGTEVDGKILVFVDSFGSPSSYFTARAYASAIENILRGDIVKKWEHGHIWLSMLGLLIAAIIVSRIRLVLSILVLLALLPCALCLASYLYLGYNILVDIFYVIFALAMAVSIFPILVMGRHVQ